MFVFSIMSDDLRQDVLYHQVEPQATQDSYTEFDNVDFVINVGEGRSLLKNSVRVLADLSILADGTNPSAVNCGFDRCAGAHSFIDSVQDVDFSLKPVCALNRMSGDDLPSSKTGPITLTCNLARNRVALMGSGQTPNSVYQLKNLRCTYQSVADDGSSSQTAMRTVFNIKSNILSGSASVSANVPAMCSSVVVSFCDTRNENDVVVNSLALEEPQALTEVQYLFNDQTNSLITYVIDDRTEMLERFIDAMGVAGHNQVAKDVFKANQGFGLGLDFDGLVDLSKNRFTMQLQTGANNVPSNVYLYFSSQAVI